MATAATRPQKARSFRRECTEQSRLPIVAGLYKLTDEPKVF